MLADAMPYISYAVLDDQRRPKLGWRALQTASKPVIVVADLHSSSLELGSHTCEIHVVSDLREKITSAIVTITLGMLGHLTQSNGFLKETSKPTALHE